MRQILPLILACIISFTAGAEDWKTVSTDLGPIDVPESFRVLSTGGNGPIGQLTDENNRDFIVSSSRAIIANQNPTIGIISECISTDDSRPISIEHCKRWAVLSNTFAKEPPTIIWGENADGCPRGNLFRKEPAGDKGVMYMHFVRRIFFIKHKGNKAYLLTIIISDNKISSQETEEFINRVYKSWIIK